MPYRRAIVGNAVHLVATTNTARQHYPWPFEIDHPGPLRSPEVPWASATHSYVWAVGMDRAVSRSLMCSRAQKVAACRMSHLLPQSTIHSHDRRAKLASRSKVCQSASSCHRYTYQDTGWRQVQQVPSLRYESMLGTRNSIVEGDVFLNAKTHFWDTHIMLMTDHFQTQMRVSRDFRFNAEPFRLGFAQTLIRRVTRQRATANTPPILRSTPPAMRWGFSVFQPWQHIPSWPTLFRHARRNSPFGIFSPDEKISFASSFRWTSTSPWTSKMGKVRIETALTVRVNKSSVTTKTMFASTVLGRVRLQGLATKEGWTRGWLLPNIDRGAVTARSALGSDAEVVVVPNVKPYRTHWRF